MIYHDPDGQAPVPLITGIIGGIFGSGSTFVQDLLDDGKINTNWKTYVGNTVQGAITGANVLLAGFGGGFAGNVANQLITTGGSKVSLEQSAISGLTTAVTAGAFSATGQVTSTAFDYIKDYAIRGALAGVTADVTYQYLNNGIVRDDNHKVTGYSIGQAINNYSLNQTLRSGGIGAVMAPVGAKIVEIAIDKWGSQFGVRTIEVNGRKIIQNDKLIDPSRIDSSTGLTNKQLMEQGKAPIGPDGNRINIHHINQTNDGPVMEITSTDHQQNSKILHTNTGQYPSKINRNEFNAWRIQYWKIRGNNLK